MTTRACRSYWSARYRLRTPGQYDGEWPVKVRPQSHPLRQVSACSISFSTCRAAAFRPIRRISLETRGGVTLLCRPCRGRGGFGGQERSHVDRNLTRPSSRARPLEQGAHCRPEAPTFPKHVWSIRVRLEMAENRRELALFNMAIDCKLRGCDLVCLRVNDVYAAGRAKEPASDTQSKTRKPVRFEIKETTRLSVER